MNAKKEEKAGRGQKNCVGCGVVIGARSLKCEKCGSDQPRAAKTGPSKRPKSSQNIANLTVQDYQLILKLAAEIKSGKTAQKPEAPKPTVEDLAAAIGNDSKLNQLKKLFDAWKAFESSDDVPAKVRNRIQEAIKG